MSQLLKGKRGIIFGVLDQKSIAYAVAQKCKEQGAQFTLTNTPAALRFGATNEIAEELGTISIPADATSMDDLDTLYKQSIDHLGGNIDFVLHSVGMSINVRKGRAYTDLNHEWSKKSIDISALSFHKVMQVAYQNDYINEWGSVVGLTYMAAQRTFPDYSEMAESKSILESIARSFGYHYGVKKNVRVNTISQSPTMTTAGSGVKGFDSFFDYADKMSPLGNADAASCADYCVTLFSDLTRMVTMQNLYHDGGFSMMGMNAAALGI